MSDVIRPYPAPIATRRLVAPELLEALDGFPVFELSDEILALIRTGLADNQAIQPPPLTPEQAAVSCEERFAPAADGAPEVRMLIYTPPGEAGASRPAYLHIHGGGYVLGSPEMMDAPNRAIVADLGCVLVSVDYRLAPETRFPGAVEDGYAALRWLHANADALGVDRGRIAIGGESAGGGHAAALAIHARNRGEIPICFQLLDSPMLDDRTGSTADPHPYCGEFVWTPANNRFGWRALLGMEPGGADVPPEAVPARVADLSGLPPAFIIVGSVDLFLEEGMDYARRLMRAGVPAELHVIPGGFHGFGLAGPQSELVQSARRLSLAALARAFRGPPAG
jgi:triacylglycerol lipase